jgi:hypothetical protein
MPNRFPVPDVAKAEEIAVLADLADVLGDQVAEILDRIQNVLPVRTSIRPAKEHGFQE